jgi:hypothetical protein
VTTVVLGGFVLLDRRSGHPLIRLHESRAHEGPWPHHIFVNQDFKVIGAND